MYFYFILFIVNIKPPTPNLSFCLALDWQLNSNWIFIKIRYREATIFSNFFEIQFELCLKILQLWYAKHWLPVWCSTSVWWIGDLSSTFYSSWLDLQECGACIRLGEHPSLINSPVRIFIRHSRATGYSIAQIFRYLCTCSVMCFKHSVTGSSSKNCHNGKEGGGTPYPYRKLHNRQRTATKAANWGGGTLHLKIAI